METRQITRIGQLEKDFDLVREAADGLDAALDRYVAVRNRIRRLSEYQESGRWLRDFEADERGELPQDMKRGILSEDALYNLLQDLSRLRTRMKRLGRG